MYQSKKEFDYKKFFSNNEYTIFLRVCQNRHILFFCFFASSLLDFPYAAINSVFLP